MYFQWYVYLCVFVECDFLCRYSVSVCLSKLFTFMFRNSMCICVYALLCGSAVCVTCVYDGERVCVDL